MTKPRILLIEDDPDVRTVFEHILLDQGYEVDSTQTISGGKELLCCRDYDLVLADGRLSDGTGMELADRARDRGIPALIVTGYAFNLPHKDGIDLATYDVLWKPMHPNELLDAVERALANPPPKPESHREPSVGVGC